MVGAKHQGSSGTHGRQRPKSSLQCIYYCRYEMRAVDFSTLKIGLNCITSKGTIGHQMKEELSATRVHSKLGTYIVRDKRATRLITLISIYWPIPGTMITLPSFSSAGISETHKCGKIFQYRHRQERISGSQPLRTSEHHLILIEPLPWIWLRSSRAEHEACNPCRICHPHHPLALFQSNRRQRRFSARQDRDPRYQNSERSRCSISREHHPMALC